jgi:peptidoglycan/xylan/chitin deacetylase (PgdA/CDA1 family)
MKSQIKAVATNLLAALLHPRLLRLLNRNRLTILMYHGVIERPLRIPDSCMIDVKTFRSQVRYLKKHFTIVSLAEAIELMANNTIEEHTVVITFDDGYQNNLDLAYPILQEENLPATVFLSTSFIDSDTTIWTGVLQNAFELSQKTQLEWHSQFFDLGTFEKKKSSLRTVINALKASPQQSLMDEVDKIVRDLSEGDPISLATESPYRMLSSDSIRKLAKSDLIELGGHTHTHYVLSRVPFSMQETEIQKSLQIVESFTGVPCQLFAYPNGKSCDYNDETMYILRENGVRAAVTTESGTCGADSPMLEIRRISVDSAASMPDFKLSLFFLQGRTKELLAMKGLN